MNTTTQPASAPLHSARRRNAERRQFLKDRAAASEVIGTVLLIGMVVALAVALAVAVGTLRKSDVPVTKSGARATFGSDGYWLEPTGPNDIPVQGTNVHIQLNGTQTIIVPLSSLSPNLANQTNWPVGQRICVVGTAAGCWRTDATSVEITLFTRYNYVFQVKELLRQDPPFNLPGTPGGPIVLVTHVPVLVQNIGAQITCGSSGPVMPVTAELTQDGGNTYQPLWNGSAVNPNGGENLTLPSVPVSAQLGIRGKANAAGGCSSVTRVSTPSNPHVMVLGPGDPAPNKPAFGNQAMLEVFLQPYVNTETRTMVLNYNQVIILFEFASDLSSPAADFQDLVILFTFG